MSIFKPADNYKDLLRQARSLNMIVKSQEKVIYRLNDEIDNLRRNKLLIDPVEIEGQRNANQELTNLLQEKEEQIEDLKEQLKVATDHIEELQWARSVERL